jgi:hypothetical protein
MMILVKIESQFMPKLQQWFECEGIKLVEEKDGAFLLWVTKDIVSAKRVDEQNAKTKEFLDKILPE